ncbi:MAG: hypothetical protein AAGA75_09815 [Cyanobacteria bacterium P01_E01_bin.6]
MVSAELISTLRELNRSDKFYIMQLLISELAQQEGEFTCQIASNWSNAPSTQEFLNNISLNDSDEQLRKWTQKQLAKLNEEDA